MIEKFRSYIESQNLINESDKILLTVSGGIDSVCMSHLFQKAGYAFDIAHCNFKLRGKESDEDQEFVKKLAKKYKSHFYTIDFETEKYAQKNGLSIQMAARELRYNWFDRLAKEHQYSCIALAHNRNDIVETMLINLIRGTGIKGLTGIKPRNDRIIRPLLFATRAEIMNYAKEKKLKFREDSSNKETKYHRNLIRKEIIPLIERINPAFTETILEESEIFQAVDTLYRNEIEHIRRAITITDDKRIVFSIPKIQSLRLSAPVFFDLISIYGFTYTHAKNLIRTLSGNPGKQFNSDKYIMLKDRKTVIIEKITDRQKSNIFYFDIKTEILTKPIKLKIKKIKNDSSFKFPGSNKCASIDMDKLIFPLQIRKWQKGDFFIPLGLRGEKKLSDFFIDRKINRIEKEKTWLLLSDNKIVWVIGHQIDDRYKITEDTRNIIQIELMD